MTARLKPDYVFESSWEVCNKVGGIYTVLSSRAKTLVELLGQDRLIFIGPDFGENINADLFSEDSLLYADWKRTAAENNLKIRIGRWNIPGNPIAILVDFHPFFVSKDAIFAKLWEDFKVDSLHSYGDYDEASMFSYAAAKVVESFYLCNIKSSNNCRQKIVYHGNEWMTGLGLLYIKKFLPEIATIFTTHATSIGRSIAGNQKPLYEYLWAYNGDQMAQELNMESKQSIEKQTAWNVDCFTTVSDITARECKELLDKDVDVVLPNGFEDDFLPANENEFEAKRKNAREKMLKVANKTFGTNLDDNTLIISTSGRFEYRNKGLDVFIESIRRLTWNNNCSKSVLAFIFVPYFNVCQPEIYTFGSKQICLLPIPYYLNGNDGIINMEYYDVIIGNDLCIYPSYYEPWGYTPLEAIAFKVPCITTDLAGFGAWAKNNNATEIEDGVKVIHRTDYNFDEAVFEIRDTIQKYADSSQYEIDKSRINAAKLSKLALWDKFITYYRDAYDIALRKKV